MPRAVICCLVALATLGACAHRGTGVPQDGGTASALAELRAEQELLRREQAALSAKQDTLIDDVDRVHERLDGLVAERERSAPRRASSPDPAAIYHVPIDFAQVWGPLTAKVTVVEWADYQCPFCGRVETTMAELRGRYAGDIRFVFMNNPLPMHSRALAAAVAAEAAGCQGKFWEMHDLLFANQRELSDKDILKYAKKLSLDLNRFRRDLADSAISRKIASQQALANSLGARGTPAFFINGRYLAGAQPVEAFSRIIGEEIKRAEAALASGVAVSRLYEHLIDKGRREP